MAKEKTESKCDCGCGSRNNTGAATGGAVYGFGLFGALYYYLSTAGSFSAGLLGVLKAIVWPGMMVYYLFKFLGM